MRTPAARPGDRRAEEARFRDLFDRTAVRVRAFAQALAELEPGEREVLLLTGWDGLDTAGVAAVLGCSAGAARMRLSRARRHLESVLTAGPPEPGLALGVATARSPTRRPRRRRSPAWRRPRRGYRRSRN